MYVVLLFLLIQAHAETTPCLIEKQAYESTNDQVALSLTQLVELRSQIATENDRRGDLLGPGLKEVESRSDAANKAVLQETQLLTQIHDNRTLLERLNASATRLAVFDGVLTGYMITTPATSFSNSLRIVGDARQSTLDKETYLDLQQLTRLVRTLESSRSWIEQMTELREQAPETGTLLIPALHKIALTQEILQQSLPSRSAQLSSTKVSVNEAQAKFETSQARQRDFEDRLSAMQKRIEALKKLQPVQKSQLHSCMHRVQFGN